jgi:hypothetical protein
VGMVEHPQGTREDPPRPQQSTSFRSLNDRLHIAKSRLESHAGGLLAGSSHLFEGGEPGWTSHPGSGRARGPIGEQGAQDLHAHWSKIPVPKILEPDDEGSNIGKLTAGRCIEGGEGGDCKVLCEEQVETAFSKENWRPGLFRCPSPGEPSHGDHSPYGPSDVAFVHRPLRAGDRYYRGDWYGCLPCPNYRRYSKAKPDGELLKRGREEGWTLHAPPVPPTTASFPYFCARWLVRSPFLEEIAQTINELHPLKQQINQSSCELSDDQFSILVKNGFVVDSGPASNPSILPYFLGNVFLHGEEDKKRWRLLYHPALFNEEVRRRNLYGVDLPRLRRILRAAESSVITIKIDLKCAFFQVPVEEGIFCFKHRGRLISLTRLPMGASVSVQVAQQLAIIVASELSKCIDTLISIETNVKFNCFVDDIFICFTPKKGISNLEDVLRKTMFACANKFNVTFKIFQIYAKPCLSPITETVVYPVTAVGGPTDYTDDLKVCQIDWVDEIEILGTVFVPSTRLVRMKDAFKTRALETFDLLNPSSITPMKLWKIVGTCFHVTYALGICMARFHGVLRLVGRVATKLNGATKNDPRWDSLLRLEDHEGQDLKDMVEYVKAFPTVTFRPFISPSRCICTDASDYGYGAVLYSNGQVSVISGVWSNEERLLPISSRELIAAWIGTATFVPALSDEAPLLAVDNTAAYFALVNSRDPEPHGNAAAGNIRTHCCLHLMWIPSELMPADGASRGVHDPHLIDCLAVVLRLAKKTAYLPRLV